MFQYIDMVVGGFSLVAFAIAAVLAFTKHVINREKHLIETAVDEHKAKLVQQAIDKYHIPSNNLTKQQKYELILAGMANRAQFWNKLFLMVSTLCLITAVATVVILFNQKHTGAEVDFLEQESFVEAQDAYFYAEDEALAYKKYLVAANKDNPFAMAALAKLLFNGWGVEKSTKTAEFWAKKAIPILEQDIYQNNGWAKYSLAYLYDAGIGIPKNEVTALELYKEASNFGVGIASQNLALNLRDQLEPEKINEAERLLKLARRQNKQERNNTLRALGELYYFDKYGKIDYALAEEYFIKAFELGAKDVAFNIGLINLHQFKPANYERAKKYLEFALGQDEQRAYSQLAQLHLREDYVDRDPQKAIDYLQIASTKGISFADYRLALLYQLEQSELDDRNIPLVHSNEKALQYYRSASDGGQSYATLDLAKAYLWGWFDLPIDTVTANELFNKAWKQGNKNAPYYIGYYYEFHLNELGYKNAIEWYNTSIEEGELDTYMNVLRILNKDETVKDKYRAMKELVDSSGLDQYEDDETRALFARMNAYIYANNGSEAEVHEKAEAYLLEALELGSEDAIYELARLYNHSDWNPENGDQKAFDYFTQAAPNNYCAENYLGIYYENKKVSEFADYENALKHYLNAANRGSEYGMFNYGRLVAKGLGTEKNIPLALDYLKKADERGAWGASLVLFEIYNDPQNAEYDKAIAKKYLIDAAQKDHSEETIDDAFLSWYEESKPQYTAAVCAAG